MNENSKIQNERCPICNTNRSGITAYCSYCGFAFATKCSLQISDIVMNQRGICTACAPTGFTECDCLTTNQTPRHLRKKSKPKPVSTELPKPIPTAKPKDQQKTQPAQIQQFSSPTAKKKKSLCRFITAPFICLGTFTKALLKIISSLVTVALVIVFIGTFLYFFLFWLEHHR